MLQSSCFFSQCSKFYEDFKNPIKFPEKVFGFLDKSIGVGCAKFFILSRKNFSSVLNVFTNKPKIWDLPKIYTADFSSVFFYPLTHWLPKGFLKQRFRHYHVFRNQWFQKYLNYGVHVFLKMFKILWRFQKRNKISWKSFWFFR